MKNAVAIISLPLLCAYAFETSNIQYLYSSGFENDTYIYDTVDGEKSTITFEHFRTWTLGDIFMFVDLTDGTKLDHTTEYEAYSEISPRLSLSKISGSDLSAGIFGDWYLSAQINSGNGYTASPARRRNSGLERIQGVYGNAMSFSGRHRLSVAEKPDFGRVPKISLSAWTST